MTDGDEAGEPSLSDDADALYRPVEGLELWLGVPVDHDAWSRDIDRLEAFALRHREWTDMVQRGVQLAAAHQSAVRSGQLSDDQALALALVSGEGGVASLAAGPKAHVVANYQALRLACEGIGGDGREVEALVRTVHAAACRPQATHVVTTAAGDQDHVLAHGDYKHHPNHVRRSDGSWRALVPVARLESEVARVTQALGSPEFTGLHPFAQAAFALHSMTHVAPFEAGNGRVGRAFASAYLLRAGAAPLVMLAETVPEWQQAQEAADDGDPAPMVGFVARRCAEVVRMIGEAHADPPTAGQSEAADRWRRRATAAGRLMALLPGAVDEALARHRGRPPVAWQSDLAGAGVVPPVTPGAPLVVRVRIESGAVIDETFDIDAHPVDGDSTVVALHATRARLRLDVEAHEVESQAWTAMTSLLGTWLDRVTMAHAIAVAAELE